MKVAGLKGTKWSPELANLIEPLKSPSSNLQATVLLKGFMASSTDSR